MLNQAALEQARRYPLIGLLTQEDLSAILPFLQVNEYAANTIILKQGQVSAQFHIVLSGILDIILENEVEVSVAKLAKGHFFGEMSCLTGEMVSATVKAEGPVQTVSMPREGILMLMNKSESFRNRMIEAMIGRIAKSNERIVEEHARSIVIAEQLERERVSRQGDLVGNSPFMRGLRAQIERLAKTDEPVCIVGETGVGKFHTACEIHQQSSRSRYPILKTDAAELQIAEWEWKVRANKGGTVILEQADLLPAGVLERLAASAAGQTRLIMTACHMPVISIPVVEMIPLRERTEDIPELVYEFLRKSGAPSPVEVISQEAIRMIGIYPFLKDNIKGLKQVVQQAYLLSGGSMILGQHLRFGGGRKPGAKPVIGVALGSGSARGAAHVGVLKVLEQEKIPVDLIAGTSVGAFIGALYAGGQPISAFEQVLPTVRWRQLVQFVMPPKAFADNHPMIRFVEKYIGPVDFADLPIPFAAVASDAASGEAYILNQGRVSHAICASTAIPGIMKPVRYRNRTLIDGAVTHPVPVALAKSMGADIVIAVDIGTPLDERKLPGNFVSSILNTIEIMSTRLVQEEMQLADVVLNPHLGINQITFKASASFIEAGEKAAREAMDAIKGSIANFGV